MKQIQLFKGNNFTKAKDIFNEIMEDKYSINLYSPDTGKWKAYSVNELHVTFEDEGILMMADLKEVME